ncbi:hypothetical protein M1349_02740 [Patescibacteria group bacterium]|nr:hypothetical protein [Patescibacteria group bacterium]
MPNKEIPLETRMSRGDFLKKTGLASIVLVFSASEHAKAFKKSKNTKSEPSREIEYTVGGAGIGAVVGAGATLSGNVNTEYVEKFSYYKVSRRGLARIGAGLLSGLVFGGISGNQLSRRENHERALRNSSEQPPVQPKS